MLVLSCIGGDRSGSAELRIKETTTGQRSPQKHALLALIRRPELAPLAGAERGGETHGAQPNTGINTALADQATTIPVGIKRQGARTAQSNHLLLAGEHPPRGDLKRQFQAGLQEKRGRTAAMRRSPTAAAASWSPRIAGPGRLAAAQVAGAGRRLFVRGGRRGAGRGPTDTERPTIYLVFLDAGPAPEPNYFWLWCVFPVNVFKKNIAIYK